MLTWWEHIIIIVLISCGFNFIQRWVYGEWYNWSNIFGVTLFSGMVWALVYAFMAT
jgi:hypothetical protein